MTGPSLRAWLYSIIVLVAPFGALGLGDPSPAVVAIPAALLLTYGLVNRSRREPVVRVERSVDRTPEGVPFDLHLTVEGDGAAAHVQLELGEDMEMLEVRGARRVAEDGLVVPMWRGRGEAVLSIVARCWGTFRPGMGRVTVPGGAGMTTASSRIESGEELVVLPDLETARRLVEPYATNLHAGDIVSRSRGPGSDFAELRPFSRGDTPRAINWRASLRTERLWVSERHAERNGDLILLIDSIVAPGTHMEEAVTRAVRIVASLVKLYGRSRHRLGLISLSGVVRWFGLGSGALHEHRLLAAAMSTQSVTEPVWLAIDRVLDRAVRPPSMVVVVSPLLDDELIGRVLRLGKARIDVVVVAVDASTWLDPPRDRTQRLARRLWSMERQRTLDGLRGAGVAVGVWRPDRPLDEILEEVEEWRRFARRARA